MPRDILPDGIDEGAQPYWTVDELSQLFNVSVHTVWRLAREHRIEYIRIGRALRFRPAAVQEFLDKQTLRGKFDK